MYHRVILTLGLTAALSSSAAAFELHLSDRPMHGDHEHRLPKLAHKDPTPRPRDPKPSKFKGHYDREACYAKHALGPGYVGCYTGGSGVVLGKGHRNIYQDGTWGVDYVGLAIKRHVWLHWTHGRVYKGGMGAYKTDGPNFAEAIKERIKKK